MTKIYSAMKATTPIRLDPSQLKQMRCGCLSNATQAAAAGGSATVRAFAKSENGPVTLRLRAGGQV